MKRVFIVLDALRRDTAKEILAPAFPEATFREITALDNYTAPVFKEFSEAVDKFNGWKGVICGGALAGMHFEEDNLDYFDQSDVYPLLKIGGLLPGTVKDWTTWTPAEENAIWLFHDYFIHNYNHEVMDAPLMMVASGKGIAHREELMAIYRQRTLYLIPILQKLIKRFKGWEIYITADHGEAFWEDGVSYHHGAASTQVIKREGLETTIKESAEVMNIWMLDFQNSNLTQLEILNGKEIT